MLCPGFPKPLAKGMVGMERYCMSHGHPTDPYLATKHSSHSEHPNMGGQSSLAPEAPAFQHTRDPKRPDWGGCRFPFQTREAADMPCKMPAIKGKRHFLQHKTCAICPSPSSSPTKAQRSKFQSPKEVQSGQGCDFLVCPAEIFRL